MLFSTEKLIHTLGDTDTYDDLIGSYCSRIQKNKKLEPFFGNFDSGSLISLQKVFLVAAFADLASKDKQDQLHRRVLLFHHRLFELGLNEIHFDMLKHHFLDALREFTANKEVYESCSTRFESLRYVFGKTETDPKVTVSRTGRRADFVRSKSACNPLSIGKGEHKTIPRRRSGDMLLNMFRLNKEK
eukprot:scaffold4822_cov73-Cylindrotheca_fusiformis.AAC.2